MSTVQNWYPQATGNRTLDEIFKQILNIVYSLSSANSKAISAIQAKLNIPGSSPVPTPTSYQGPTVQNIVSSSRVLGTVYQNTFPTAMFVTVSLASASVSGSIQTANAFISQTGAFGGQVASTSFSNSGASNITITEDMTFVVPSQWFYKVSVSAGTPTIQYWTEWT